MAQKVKHLPAMWETLDGEDPLEKDLASPSGTLAWKIPGHHFEGNPVDEGTTEGLLTLPCIVQKNPQVLYTTNKP